MVRNYREGPQWISGTIAEKRGPLTYLVEIREDILWKRHIDQIIQAADTPDDVSSCVSLPTPTVPVLPAPLPLPLTPPRNFVVRDIAVGPWRCCSTRSTVGVGRLTHEETSSGVSAAWMIWSICLFHRMSSLISTK